MSSTSTDTPLTTERRDIPEVENYKNKGEYKTTHQDSNIYKRNGYGYRVITKVNGKNVNHGTFKTIDDECPSGATNIR